MRALLNEQGCRLKNITLSRKPFRLVEKGHNRLTAGAVAHPLQVSQSCREPFSKEGTCFVGSGIPQNGAYLISACTKTETRIIQHFLSSWFHWLETSSLFIYLEQVSEQAVERSTKIPIIICNCTVMFITVFHRSDFLYETISCLTTS